MSLARDSSSASLFSANVAGTLRLIVYLALAVAVMVADRRIGILHHVRYAASVLIEPVYTLAALPSRFGHMVTAAVADRRKLEQDNTRLRESLLLANARINRMRALVEQNQRLKQLLEVQHSLGMDVQLARVVGVDLGQFRHRIVLDVGSEQGVYVGQAVIDAFGVVGQVIEILPNSAVVMLISDPNHAIPVMVERTGLRTIAYGLGATGQLVLPTVPMSADVHAGDVLLTSGLGGRFPSGFPVGKITSIKPDSNHRFARAQVAPAAALERTGEVLLLRDLAPAIGPPQLADPVGPPATARSSMEEPQ